MTLQEFKPLFGASYTLVDFDLVENANLYRQQFIPADLGLNKAEVLAQRYTLSFGFPVLSCPEKLESVGQLERIFRFEHNTGANWTSDTCHILIGCVDNSNARKIMHEFFQKYTGNGFMHSLVYIDAGNGKLNGQTVMGFKKGDKVFLPPPGDVFPELIKKEKKKPVVNCAANALRNPQNIGANIMASTIIFGMLNTLMTEGQIPTQIAVFDARTQSVRGIPTNIENDKTITA